jgi:hypothetical protein
MYVARIGLSGLSFAIVTAFVVNGAFLPPYRASTMLIITAGLWLPMALLVWLGDVMRRK